MPCKITPTGDGTRIEIKSGAGLADYALSFAIFTTIAFHCLLVASWPENSLAFILLCSLAISAGLCGIGHAYLTLWGNFWGAALIIIDVNRAKNRLELSHLSKILTFRADFQESDLNYKGQININDITGITIRTLLCKRHYTNAGKNFPDRSIPRCMQVSTLELLWLRTCYSLRDSLLCSEIDIETATSIYPAALKITYLSTNKIVRTLCEELGLNCLRLPDSKYYAKAFAVVRD